MSAPRIFNLRNLRTNRCYDVTGNENTTMQTVWDSQKCWFVSGAEVEIVGPDGKIAKFVR